MPSPGVANQGFSIRPNPFGVGSRLSYGLILHNGSRDKDARSVNVQVNFVMADDHLLGTDTQRVDAIAAGSDSSSFAGCADAARAPPSSSAVAGTAVRTNCRRVVIVASLIG